MSRPLRSKNQKKFPRFAGRKKKGNRVKERKGKALSGRVPAETTPETEVADDGKVVGVAESHAEVVITVV
ncbi:MAG: hypothetical protein D6722_15120, partial [Bacteroidetes bacterium]